MFARRIVHAHHRPNHHAPKIRHFPQVIAPQHTHTHTTQKKNTHTHTAFSKQDEAYEFFKTEGRLPGETGQEE